MHEALVGARNPEGREVPFDPPTVVHQCIRIGRTVGIVMDELVKAQVAEQPDLLGVAEVGSQRPTCRIRLQDSRPGEGKADSKTARRIKPMDTR